MSNARMSGVADDTAVPLGLEAIVIPVADFDRATHFYVGLGWRVDAEASLDDGHRLMQLTPPGSSDASVIFGNHGTSAQPGSLDARRLTAFFETARRVLVRVAGEGVAI